MDVTDSVAANRQRVVGFADVVRIPLRRRSIVLIVTAVVTLAVAAYLLFLPATYKATTVVVLRPVVTDPFTTPPGGADRAINMTAESGVALGNEVVDAISQRVGRDTDDVRDALTVEVPTGGAVLRFEYQDDSEEDAVTGANLAAETYLKVREGIYQRQREGLLRSYDSSAKQVGEQVKTAQRALGDENRDGDRVPPRTQAVLDQVSKLNDQIVQLATQRAKIASADLSPGAVTAAARPPVPSSHDAWALYLLGALLGGLLLGAVAAHAREALDRRVRSVDQAADLIGTPALGVVRSAGRQTDEAAAADARYVSLAVLKWIDRHPDQPIVVLSGRDDEGRTTVSGNVAVALAEAGRDVWLAAADNRHDELHRILATAQKRTPPRGRSVPADGADVQRNGTPSPGGTPPPMKGTTWHREDPEATLIMEAGGKRTAAPPKPLVTPVVTTQEVTNGRRPLVSLIGSGVVRLCALGEQPGAGVVVLDAPPSDVDERGVREAQNGAAVLVVARDRTRNTDLTRLVDRLRSAGAQTLGFVLTGGRGD
jgi:Mrp family chromosome partitioning ATPase